MSGPWWEGRALAFDTETSGLNVAEDRIVTIALVRLGGGTPTRTGHLINPGIDIPTAATAVHGITTEHARAHGVDPASALEASAAALADAMKNDTPVVGMNIAFDFAILHFDCLRNGVPTLSQRLGGHDRVRPVIDCAVLDKQADKYRKGSRKLADLCATYKVKHHGTHDSGYDALAAADVAATIGKRHPPIGRMSVQELHDAQVAWKSEQNTGLQVHFDRKRADGEERTVVETGWPLYDLVTGQPC